MGIGEEIVAFGLGF